MQQKEVRLARMTCFQRMLDYCAVNGQIERDAVKVIERDFTVQSRKIR
jgi:hypothetical protein